MASRPAGSEQTSAWIIIAIVLAVLLALLAVAGSWMLQQKQAEKAEVRAQARAVEQYRESTRPVSQPPQLPAHYVEAQRIRQKLLAHPAVIPGPGFNAKGVQRTGLAIVEALDRAQN